jgi:polar amino acid transport system substrate-binding protein
MTAHAAPSLAAVRAQLAPTGTLRAGLNFSNFLLTARDAAGTPSGVAVDLARELGRRLEVPVSLVGYEAPGPLADAAQAGAWDIAFLGAEPARAEQIAFSAAYVEIEATYLVPAGSAIRSVEEVDRPGLRISISGKSAYDLYLTRALKHAQLVRIAGVDASYEQFVTGKFDALAGLRPRLIKDVEKLPGARILPGRFTAIQQAIGTPRGRGDAGADYLRAFVEDVKARGLVAKAIADHHVVGLTVAPPAH